MCAWVAMVGAGVFASSNDTNTNTSTASVATSIRQGIFKQFKKFKGGGNRVQSETIKAAIEANDYAKLSTTEQGKITKEQFTKMVAMHKVRAAHEAAILVAVKANDFTAFTKAQTEFKATMDTNKPTNAPAKDETRPKPTTEQQKARFDELVSYYKTNGKLPEMKMGMKGKEWGKGKEYGMMMSSTVKSAVQTNDYMKLSTDEQTKITKDQFAKMVTMHTTMQAGKVAIETAVKNNDFTAFKTTIMAQHMTMEANKPVDNDVEMNDDQAPTDAQLKTHFDKMVTYYKTNGKLPEMKMGMGEKGEGMMEGNREEYRDGQDQESDDDSTTK